MHKDLEDLTRLRGQEGPGRTPLRDQGHTRGRRAEVVLCIDEFGPLNLQPHPGRQWTERGGSHKDPALEPRPRRRAPGPGWCGMPKSRVVGRLGELAKRHAWWNKDLRGDRPRLAEDVRGVLEPEADLLRVTGGFEEWWWLSPAAARWTVLSEQAPVPAQCGDVAKGVKR